MRRSRSLSRRTCHLPAQVGLLFRQFDGLEVHERPWEACEQDCHTTLFHEDTTNKGPGVPGRLSFYLAYRALRERPDRKSISLAYEDRAGYVLRNEEISLQCLYGKDAAVRMPARTDSNPALARRPADRLSVRSHPHVVADGQPGKPNARMQRGGLPTRRRQRLAILHGQALWLQRLPPGCV